ncbi:putative capsid protein 4 [Cafeteria roenbergensis virus]|uniref:Putative capsid protein 4 n=1 Tax=Cafeteria roenbergensis virus (strain BV-PW1) TaxID=693272 RepID=E3T4U6_CROVB|nr:putative capsid protein 4 [Cafeteria roenbergensis virus BV-PW1]ADO67209.1 putative capsid protein 4 [Cafeteria roenbergensis virus BV-PW1]
MSVGLLILATNSGEKHFITNKPEITFFKKVYKRHTNFSVEVIPSYFINPIDFGRNTTLNVSKHGDLINEIYLHLKLPPLISSNDSLDNFKIQYVKNLGYSLIKKIELEIGGNVLTREYGEWLYIWNELTTPLQQKRGVNIILGNTDIYTKAEPTKNSLSLNIPLYFWFNNGTCNSLPLVSLSKDDIKIHIELRKLSEVIKQTPEKQIKIIQNFCSLKEGDEFYQIINGKKSVGIFYKFDLTKNLIYYNSLIGEIVYSENPNENILYTSYDDTFEISNEINSIGKVGDYFNLNYPSLVEGYCLINYIFLDNEERYLYLTKNHEYLVQVPQNLTEESFSSSNIKYNLHLVHPVVSIYFRVILEQNIINKDYFEYSKYPLTDKDVIENKMYNGNKLLKTDSLIKKIKLFINGQQLSNIDNPYFFNLLQNVKYYGGRGNEFIYKYSFSINPLSKCQPFGSLNFSKIDDSYLQLTLDGVIDYQNPVRIKGYAVNHNIFRIINGIGKFVFAS